MFPALWEKKTTFRLFAGYTGTYQARLFTHKFQSYQFIYLQGVGTSLAMHPTTMVTI